MTRREAVKEYKAIRKRGQWERTPRSDAGFDDCLRKHGWHKACGEIPEDLRLECLEQAHNDAFDAFVMNFLSCRGITHPTPEQWVEAARKAPFLCGRCAGTGQFVTYVENGVPKGPGGVCFRCGGKGHQTDEDAVRNYYYDLHAFEEAARSMMRGG